LIAGECGVKKTGIIIAQTGGIGQAAPRADYSGFRFVESGFDDGCLLACSSIEICHEILTISPN
jgi:hypothetical protein